MKMVLISVIFLILNGNGYCESIESLRNKDYINLPSGYIKNVESMIKPVVPKLDLKYLSKVYSFIDMSVNVNNSMKEIRGSDFRNKIEVDVRKSYTGRFDGYIRIDGMYESIYISNYSNSFSISTSYGNLRATKQADNYYISGNVMGNNGQYQYISLTVYKRYSDDYSYEISTTGLDLDFSSYSVGGNFNDEMYSKRALGYIIALVFSFQVENIAPGK